MKLFKQLFLILIFPLSVITVSNVAYAKVSNCRSYSGEQMSASVNFDITSDIVNPPAGTQLITNKTILITMTCTFTKEATPGENQVNLRNTLPRATANLLVNSGVRLMVGYAITGDYLDFTDSGVQYLPIGAWVPKNGVSEDINITLWFAFRLDKDANYDLKPFDTGVNLVGMFTDSQGNPITSGTSNTVLALLFGSFKATLSKLCPTPDVTVKSIGSNVLDFGRMSASSIKNAPITRDFKIQYSVQKDCYSGINLALTFDSNGNKVTGDKNLDLGNGLQISIFDDKNANTPIAFDVRRTGIAELSSDQNTLIIPYKAQLSQIVGSEVITGAFSKTIKIVASY